MTGGDGSRVQVAYQNLNQPSVGAGPSFLSRLLGCFLLVTALMPLWGAATPCQAEVVFGANKSKVYHTHPDCKSGKKIKPENRVIFQSVRDAENQGRRLCRFCERLHEKDGKAAEAGRAGSEQDSSTLEERTASTSRDGSGSQASGPRSEAVEPPVDLPADGRVRQVLPDGTLELEGGEKVRLLGVSWPRPRQPGAEDVVQWLRSRAEHKSLALVYDSGRTHCRHRDSMGRIWAYAQVQSQGVDLGAAMIEQGLGWVNREIPFARHAAYDKCEGEAWWGGRGIWKRLEGDAGDRLVVVGRYGRHYYPAGSVWIASLIEPTEITLNEAKSRRLTPPSDTGIIPTKKKPEKRRSSSKGR